MSAIQSLSMQPATAELPTTGFLRQVQVLRFVPISKSTLWRQVQAGTFPQPVKLSERVTAWRAEDLRRWIDQHLPAALRESQAGRLWATPPAHAAQPLPARSPRYPQRGRRR